MYISGTENRRLLRAAAIYLAVTVLCMGFNAVYTHFSYGERSGFLAMMFLFPLAGGMLPAVLTLFAGKARGICRMAFNLWNSGIAALVCGCLVRGVINISGRFTEYDIWYWLAGGMLLLSAAAATVCHLRTSRHAVSAAVRQGAAKEEAHKTADSR